MIRPLVVWVCGADRPGIVAAVTGALEGAGCELMDSSMGVLSTYFTMTIMAVAPDDLDPGELETALAGAEPGFELTVCARPLGEGATIFVEGDAYVVSAYGADQPGMLHEVAVVLADASVNLTDVHARVMAGDDEGGYATLLEVTLPYTLDPAALDERLQDLAGRLGIDISLHPADDE